MLLLFESIMYFNNYHIIIWSILLYYYQYDDNYQLSYYVAIKSCAIIGKPVYQINYELFVENYEKSKF